MCLILLRYGIETRGAAPSSVVLYAIPPDQDTAESRGLSKRDWRKSVLVSRVVVSQTGNGRRPRSGSLPSFRPRVSLSPHSI